MNAFGKILRAFRISRGYGLRQFAEMIGELPSNLSATEHGRRRPFSPEKLRRVADSLALIEGSPDWDRLFSAARQPGELHAHVDIEREMQMEIFPVLCRTLNEARLTEDQMRELVEYIRKQRNLRTDGSN